MDSVLQMFLAAVTLLFTLWLTVILQHEGFAPLHVSAVEGDEAMIKYLHSLKVDPNICDKVGTSD